MPFVHSNAVRTEIAARLNRGEAPNSIAQSLKVSLRTVYRLKKQFALGQNRYAAVPAPVAHVSTISMNQLLELSEVMRKAPKITIKELVSQAVEEGIFESEDTAPNPSTVYRKLSRQDRVQVATTALQRSTSHADSCTVRAVLLPPGAEERP